MNVTEARRAVEQALVLPVQTWLDYSPKSIPLVIYDDSEFAFLNHPVPPQERPSQLTAATSIEISGVMTATIPAGMCENEEALVPLVYHECFHVFQATGAFQSTERFDFFKALAFYPELNSSYRALCLAESEILNNTTLTAQEQAIYLAALTKRRHNILALREGLLAFERSSERREGTASYVEQKARAAMFDKSPASVACRYGWSRQYAIGAAACWLLDRLQVKGWQERVQVGEAPTDILIGIFGREDLDLAALQLTEKEAQEDIAASQILARANAQAEELWRDGAIRVQLPGSVQVFRSFNPMGIVSLGDGRLLHSEFLIVQIPHGKIAIRKAIALEDYNLGELVFRAIPFQVVDGRLEATTETVQISLSNVESASDGILKLR